jgi:hypothetical protein
MRKISKAVIMLVCMAKMIESIETEDGRYGIEIRSLTVNYVFLFNLETRSASYYEYKRTRTLHPA